MGKKFSYGEFTSQLWEEERKREKGESISKIKYYIDEYERTIVAVMEDCEYDAIKILNKMGIMNIDYKGYNLDKFMINSTYRGKAKCSPDDEWNEGEGIRIARNRMLENYYRARSLALMRAERILQAMMDDLGSRIDYSDSRYQKAFRKTL